MKDEDIWPPILTRRNKGTVSRRAVRAAARKVIAERMARERAELEAQQAKAKASSAK